MTRQSKRRPDPDKTEQNIFELNEWGIPDWRDKEAYGDVKGWTLDRWRWEFFRRREDLRSFFDERAETTYRSNQALLNHPTILCYCFAGLPSEPGFAVGGDNCGKLFGYICVPNPRIGSQPAGILKPMEDYWSFKIIDGDSSADYESTKSRSEVRTSWEKPPISREQVSSLSPVPFRYFPIDLNRHEVAIKFDIDRPIGPQLEKARETLRSIQVKRHGKQIQVRQHVNKWLQYLRSLDAREAGASWSEISTLHSETQQTDQTGRDKWNQARSLCFNF